MKKIYLVRHAEPELGGRSHVCLGGRSNPPLSEKGEAQAAAAAERFCSDVNFSVYASPLIRARQTAELISAGRWPVKTLPGMEELDCGEWDGLSFDVIKELYPERYALRGADLSVPPPGGESLESLARRGLAALHSLRDDPAENIIVVAHKGINRVLLCAIMGRPLSDYRGFTQEYVCVNRLVMENGELRVEEINCERGNFGR